MRYLVESVKDIVAHPQHYDSLKDPNKWHLRTMIVFERRTLAKIWVWHPAFFSVGEDCRCTGFVTEEDFRLFDVLQCPENILGAPGLLRQIHDSGL